MFHHAYRMGLEGIVSKRKDSTYRSGRSPDWLKMKNPLLCGGEAGSGGGLGASPIGALVQKRRHSIRERRHQCPSYGNYQNDDHGRFRRRRWDVGHDAPSTKGPRKWALGDTSKLMGLPQRQRRLQHPLGMHFDEVERPPG